MSIVSHRVARKQLLVLLTLSTGFAFASPGRAGEPIRCPDGSLCHGSKLSDCAWCTVECADGTWQVQGGVCPISANAPVEDRDEGRRRGGRSNAVGPSEEERRRDAAIANAVACSDEERETHDKLIANRGGRSVFVRAGAWAGLNRESRVGFAAWAASCLMEQARNTIRHAHTGKVLAIYGQSSGYEARE